MELLAGLPPEDVQRVARKYLTPDNRTVGWFIPLKEDGDEEGNTTDGVES